MTDIFSKHHSSSSAGSITVSDSRVHESEQSPHTGTFSALILCGGKSSRMGTDKASLPFKDTTLLDWQTVRLKKAGFSEVLVCCGSQNTKHTGMPDKAERGNRVPVRYIPDYFPDHGPLAGIYSGLQAAVCTDAFVISADCPLVPLDYIVQLCASHRNSDSVLTVARHDSRTEPLIGAYSRSLLPALEVFLKSGRRASDFMEQVSFSAFPYNGPEEFFINCNTPEDYQKLMFSQLC